MIMASEVGVASVQPEKVTYKVILASLCIVVNLRKYSFVASRVTKQLAPFVFGKKRNKYRGDSIEMGGSSFPVQKWERNVTQNNEPF